MHPAHPRPVRVIVEIDPGQVARLVTQLLDRLSAKAPPPPESSQEPAPDDAGDEADDAPPPESTADPPDRGPGQAPSHGTELATGSWSSAGPTRDQPPVAREPLPGLPHATSRRFYLGQPCHKGHTYEGSNYGLRKKSNRGCVQCDQERQQRGRVKAHTARKAQAARRRHAASVTPPAPVLPTVPSTNGYRPELPTHLQERCFLSPITCANDQHRYRGTAYTLRYLDTETCVQCVMVAGE